MISLFDRNNKKDIIIFMKRIILLILILILSVPSVFCETFTPIGVPMTKETHPITFGYFEDYAAQLKHALEKSKFYRRCGWGAAYRYIVTRAGKIEEIKGSIFQNDYYDEQIKSVILSVKPEPFREGMDYDDVLVDVYLGFEKYNEKTISVGNFLPKQRDIVDITITTKKR